MTTLNWQYDEFRSVGRDYSDPEEAGIYDPSHADFRDPVAESEAALDRLGLRRGEVVVDFGCGTGTFAVQAARRGIRVHAVDVSLAMLDQARQKAAAAGVEGIEFHHAGFLTFTLPPGSVNAIASTFAFHHLPDLWKAVALERMARMLQPGGRFYLHDVICSATHPLENIQRFIDQQAAKGGAFLREDAEGHFREEYSTYDWIMDELLARSGFLIQDKLLDGGVLGTYLSVRPSEVSA